MADGILEKPLSLAEQYSLEDLHSFPAESLVDAVAEKIIATISPVVAVMTDQNQAPEEQDTEVQAVKELPDIKIETAPADFRFPTTNQTRHCFTRYVEYHRCVAAKGEDAPDCNKFAKYYRSLCPGEWVERWNEQRENGTFPGPL